MKVGSPESDEPSKQPAGYVDVQPHGMGADAQAGVGAQFLKPVEAKLAAGHEDVVARGVRGAQIK